MTIELATASGDHGLHLVGGEPLIFHCHHYNAALQQSIEDLGHSLPVHDILRDGAVAPVHAQLTSAFAGHSAAERLAFGADLFRRLGFGTLSAGGLDAGGGQASLHDSHYALGFEARSRHGAARRDPACHFAAGFVEALAAATFDARPGSYRAVETGCAALGAEHCTFDVEKLAEPRPLSPSMGMGLVPSPMPPRPRFESNVDESFILAALSKLPLEGNEEGLIPAFGVYLTRHYANYYNYISYELERRVTAEMPRLLDAARDLLTEAGHVCAFNTFGGIMESPEWDAVVGPMLRDRRDWVAGIVSCINALGWGRWSVVELVEHERLVLRVDASYESSYYLQRFGADDQPHCHFCRGAAAGIMNLLYAGDITQKPTLDATYYDQLFSGPESFRGTEARCRSRGDDCCELVVERQTYAV